MTERQRAWQAWCLSHPVRTRSLALALATALSLLVYWLGAAAMFKLQEHSHDALWRWKASEAPEQRVILVDIDDHSLQTLGSWPWSRQTLAQLIGALDDAGVSLKLLDIVLPDAREGDQVLKAALARRDQEAPTLLAQVFALRGESELRSGQLLGAVPGIGCQAPGVPAQGHIANAAGLHHRAGHITPTLDADGSVRRISALVCAQERLYPTLALAGVASLDDSPLSISSGQGWGDAAWQIHLPSLPGRSLGVDRKGQMRLPLTTARKGLTRISAADLLQDPRSFAPMLQGAWVVVGASAFGLADVVPMALGGAVSGSEIHMQLLLGILDGQLPYTPQAEPLMQAIYTVSALLALVLLAGRSSQRLLLPAATLAAALGAWALHAWALLYLQWVLGWVVPAVVLLLCGTLLAVGEQLRMYAEKNRLFEHLSSYVSAPVAKRLATSAPSDQVQARRRYVSVLAVDIKNFAPYCHSLAPETSAQVLHHFYTQVSTLVSAHGGIVEEMAGDGLLAVFNGSQDCPEHAKAAVQAARAIWQECSAALPNTQAMGLEPLSLGIGLESGQAMIGSFGHKERRVHTVMGEVVTVALRLRSLTPDLSWPVLLGSQIAAELGQPPAASSAQGTAQVLHMELKSLGSFMLEGLTQPRNIYTLRQLLQPGTAAEQRTLAYLRAAASS